MPVRGLKNEVKFDSDEEKYFSWWLDELKAAGIILMWKKNTTPLKLTNSLYNCYTKKTVLKTKTKEEAIEQIILRGSEYTHDFEFIWKTKSKLFQVLGRGEKITAPFIAHERGSGLKSYVETKGTFDWRKMTRLFKSNQQFVWDKHKIFINLIVPQELFEKTFTPKKYLLTEKTKQKRKINWKVKSLNEYINEQPTKTRRSSSAKNK